MKRKKYYYVSWVKTINGSYYFYNEAIDEEPIEHIIWLRDQPGEVALLCAIEITRKQYIRFSNG